MFLDSTDATMSFNADAASCSSCQTLSAELERAEHTVAANEAFSAVKEKIIKTESVRQSAVESLCLYLKY